MSSMTLDHRLRIIVALACLGAIAGGCHGVPPVPEHVRNSPSYQQGDSDDGWLLDRLLRRKSAAAEQAAPSGVRQASAEEPVYPPQGSARPVPENIENALEEEKAKKRGFELSDLAPKHLYNEAKAWAGYGPDEKVARQLFDEGQDLYREKKYAEAADKFKSAASRWPNSPLEEDAMFYRAESLFFADRYVDANDAFVALMKKYENSRYLDRAVRRQFNIARYWEQLEEASPLWPIVPNLTDSTRPRFDTWNHALKAYESVQLNDPTGPLADDAVMATGNAYFLEGRYEEAANQYDLLRKQYPRSEHQYDAHRLGMKAKLLLYQGPFYDGTALDEAGRIADQTLRQFGNELGKDRDRLIQEKNDIVEQQARRDWAMGQYYDKKHYYGAARFYYKGLVENTRYARTHFAQMARDRLEQIKDRPDKPPNHFKWLTDLFPPGS
jgi:outer membrane protein assembly factor BamD (BamD/ComL family)